MRSNVMIKPLSDKLLPFSLGVDWDRELSDTDSCVWMYWNECCILASCLDMGIRRLGAGAHGNRDGNGIPQLSGHSAHHYRPFPQGAKLG